MMRWREKGITRLEVAVVAAIFAILIGTFLNTVRLQQEQAERLMVDLTIMGMRTALMTEQAERLIDGRHNETKDLLGANPIRFLKGPPVGYLGEFKEMDEGRLSGGNWYFDLAHGELVYRPKINSHFKRLDDAAKEEIRWKIQPRDSRSRIPVTVDALSLSLTVRFEWF